MNVLLLSKSQGIPSTRRLMQAATTRGHQVTVLNPADTLLDLTASGAKMDPFQVVIPRLPRSTAGHALLTVSHFENRGALCLNSVSTLQAARGDARWLQRLFSSGISILPTVMLHEVKHLKAAVKAIGSLPIQVTALGAGDPADPVVCESEQSLEAVLEALMALGHSVMLQEHLRRSARVLRQVVVGGTVTARSTFKHAVEDLQALVPLALKVAEVCDLDVCSVDISASAHGLVVTQVNPCPVLDDASADAVMAFAEARLGSQTRK